jgi:hypothetical protein
MHMATKSGMAILTSEKIHFTFTILFNIALQVLATVIRQEKEIKVIEKEKKYNYLYSQLT